MTKKLLIFDILIISITTIAIVTLNFIFGFSVLSILSSIGSVAGIIYTVLAMSTSKFSFFFGIINNIFYGIVALMTRVYLLFAYAVIFCIPILIIGIVNQLRKYKKESKIKKMSKGLFSLLLPIQLIGYIVFVFGLFMLNGNYYYLDALMTSFLMISLILLTNFILECYIYFSIGSLLGVVMYILLTIQDISNISILIMWVCYFLCAIIGFVNWTKLYRLQQNIAFKKI